MDQFYDQLTSILDKSLEAILKQEVAAVNGSVDLEKAIANSKTLLTNFSEKTKTDIRELRGLSEWDAFTIAFYGETNAGKSTIIETLRILLGDTEKLGTQKKFKELSKDLRVDPQSLASLAKLIQQLELRQSEIQDTIEQSRFRQQSEQQQQINQLEALTALIKKQRKNMSLWQKLKFLFKKTEDEKALPLLEAKFTQLVTSNKAKLEVMADKQQKISTELEARRTELAQIEKTFAQLIPLQDGNIIGNGRSDFTLNSSAYAFSANGQKFQLIDVPGIEGDEKRVMSSIDESVKKAHAVFYVTRTATPPGSGSNGQEGTIDKIKRQLGKQTEVWAIYNKSATNPQVLQGDTLANSNDAVGLEDMSKSLTSILGSETYKGHICVSGMPAFLAAAYCFVPNNPHVKSREKFLAAMKADEIIKRSGMTAFLEFIGNEICQNFKVKIKNANLKKIRSCLESGINQLELAHGNFASASKKLKQQHQSSSSQIDDLLSGTAQKLKNECHDKLSEKKTTMRTGIYSYISDDHSNDDFKEHLTNEINLLKTSIGKELEERFATVFESFKYEAGEIIKKNQKNVDEILRYAIEDPFSSLKLDFNANFKMENGINVIGLISTLGGAAALVWGSFLASNPVGWTTAAVLGAIGLVFSFYKAVRSFFSSNYKKEQQRKSTDENLDMVFSSLVETLDKNLEAASEKIDEALQKTKKQMQVPFEQSINTQLALAGLITRMKKLNDKLSST